MRFVFNSICFVLIAIFRYIHDTCKVARYLTTKYSKSLSTDIFNIKLFGIHGVNFQLFNYVFRS